MKLNRIKRKNSMEDRRKVAGRMQHANHMYVLVGSSVEDEIVFKASDRQHAHALEILVPKIPDTAETRQRHKLRTGVFQCRHKARSRLGIVGPDIGPNIEKVLYAATRAGLNPDRRFYHSLGQLCRK